MVGTTFICLNWLISDLQSPATTLPFTNASSFQRDAFTDLHSDRLLSCSTYKKSADVKIRAFCIYYSLLYGGYCFTPCITSVGG